MEGGGGVQGHLGMEGVSSKPKFPVTERKILLRINYQKSEINWDVEKGFTSSRVRLVRLGSNAHFTHEIASLI